MAAKIRKREVGKEEKKITAQRKPDVQTGQFAQSSARQGQKAPVYRLDGREHLKVVNVQYTDPGDYQTLMNTPEGRERVV
jgi:hypothetical protein